MPTQQKQPQKDVHLTQEIEALKKLVQEKDDANKRALADYINLQKRTEEDRKKLAKIIIATFASQLLEPLRNLELQFDHAKDPVIGLVIKQIKQTFEQEGIVEVGNVGDEYSAESMEVVETIDGEKNKVIRVVQKGYVLDGFVLQPAKVVVGRTEHTEKQEDKTIEKQSSEK